jgi:hypothetical protein
MSVAASSDRSAGGDVDLWGTEAERHGVLPLDDRTLLVADLIGGLACSCTTPRDSILSRGVGLVLGLDIGPGGRSNKVLDRQPARAMRA